MSSEDNNEAPHNLDPEQGNVQRTASTLTLAIDIEEEITRQASLGIYGLEYLDSIYLCPVKQLPIEIDFSEFSTHTRYEGVDYEGRVLFYAAEKDDSTMRLCCSESRSFNTKIYDLQGKDFLDICRPVTCWLCLCGVDCCLNCCNETIVSNWGSKRLVGKVRSHLNFSGPTYVVEDSNGNTVFSIYGPRWGFWIACKLCFIHEFAICLPDSKISLGKIRFGYDGLNEEKVPNPNTIGIIFPPRSDAEAKASLIAAGFMIDVTYFHKRGCTGHRFVRNFIIIASVLAAIGYGVYKLLKNR